MFDGTALPERLLQPELLLVVVLAVALGAVALWHQRTRKQSRQREQTLARANDDAQRRLRSSMSDTRAMLDQGSAAILVFDRITLTLLFANRQALDLFGCDSVEELSDTVLMRRMPGSPAPTRCSILKAGSASSRPPGFCAGSGCSVPLPVRISGWTATSAIPSSKAARHAPSAPTTFTPTK